MIRKWMLKSAVPVLALMVLGACNATNNNDDVPQGNNDEPDTENPEDTNNPYNDVDDPEDEPSGDHTGHDDSKDTDMNPDSLEGYQ